MDIRVWGLMGLDRPKGPDKNEAFDPVDVLY